MFQYWSAGEMKILVGPGAGDWRLRATIVSFAGTDAGNQMGNVQSEVINSFKG